MGVLPRCGIRKSPEEPLVKHRGVSCAQHLLVDTQLLLKWSSLWQNKLPELFTRQVDTLKTHTNVTIWPQSDCDPSSAYGPCVGVTSLFVQFGENVSKCSGVVDPFDDAALLVKGNHSVGADMQLPSPWLGIFAQALRTHIISAAASCIEVSQHRSTLLYHTPC